MTMTARLTNTSIIFAVEDVVDCARRTTDNDSSHKKYGQLLAVPIKRQLNRIRGHRQAPSYGMIKCTASVPGRLDKRHYVAHVPNGQNMRRDPVGFRTASYQIGIGQT